MRIYCKVMSITLLHRQNTLTKHTALCRNYTILCFKIILTGHLQTATMSFWNMTVCAKYLPSTVVLYSGLTCCCMHWIGLNISNSPYGILKKCTGLCEVFFLCFILQECSDPARIETFFVLKVTPQTVLQ